MSAAAGGPIGLVLDLITPFTLDEVDEAVAHAAAHPGPFERTVLTPVA